MAVTLDASTVVSAWCRHGEWSWQTDAQHVLMTIKPGCPGKGCHPESVPVGEMRVTWLDAMSEDRRVDAAMIGAAARFSLFRGRWDYSEGRQTVGIPPALMREAYQTRAEVPADAEGARAPRPRGWGQSRWEEFVRQDMTAAGWLTRYGSEWIGRGRFATPVHLLTIPEDRWAEVPSARRVKVWTGR